MELLLYYIISDQVPALKLCHHKCYKKTLRKNSSFTTRLGLGLGLGMSIDYFYVAKHQRKYIHYTYKTRITYQYRLQYRSKHHHKNHFLVTTLAAGKNLWRLHQVCSGPRRKRREGGRIFHPIQSEAKLPRFSLVSYPRTKGTLKSVDM